MAAAPHPFRSIGELVRDGVSYLVDLVSDIFNGIRVLAPIMALGCSVTTVEPDVPPEPGMATAAVVAPPSSEPEVAEPKPIGQFSITFYYVIGEEEVAAKARVANDNKGSDDTLAEIALTPDLVTVYEASQCKPIAEVSPEFASQLALQGTGKLRDGRVLNIWGRCRCGHSPCFKVTENQWGTAGTGRPLQPFRTVAVDPRVVKLGQLLYVPLLEGRVMPGRAPWGGYVHDGCVVADDTGGGIDGTQLDLFVGRKAYFLGLSGSGGSHAWARHVPVFDGSQICQRKGRVVARKSGAI